jgi:hypothetical protein
LPEFRPVDPVTFNDADAGAGLLVSLEVSLFIPSEILEMAVIFAVELVGLSVATAVFAIFSKNAVAFDKALLVSPDVIEP